MKQKTFFLILIISFTIGAYCQNKGTHFIHETAIAGRQFGNDYQWYIKNIPFFECSDSVIENVYYYRWKLYKAHLKNIGKAGYIVTEFLNAMSWDKKPFNSLNDATSFHIYEGRWIKDTRYIKSYINYMYKEGGNDRHFSEAIADAAYAFYLVHPDKKFITSQLPYMIKLYSAWYDHYDSSKNLYYIEPLLDATEYTISSIDASGGKDGFFGGDAFRPSINSYMYANALAIKNIAMLKSDTTIADLYNKKAHQIKSTMQKNLWNDSLQYFIDRYKVSNQYVTYWHFIRGRELVGIVPWSFNLPDDNPRFNQAWKHITDTTELLGKYGLRTNEPSYQYYMKQYRYDKATGQRECQWNGPSWPFQTSQALRGMANFVNNYDQHIISRADYFFILKQYAQQHYLNNKLNLVEDYDPDKGGPIVNINQRSEHYNHSEFNDLIITGLCGLRPQAGNRLVINPLIPAGDLIQYFCLENVLYHGHYLTILYDKTGKKYKQGAGLFIYVDGKRIAFSSTLSKKIITIPNAIIKEKMLPVNVAVNITGKGFPKASASYTDSSGKLNMAIDGRVWYFKNVINHWSCVGSDNKTDWYEINFEKPENINTVQLYFYEDEKNLFVPESYEIKYWQQGKWQSVMHCKKIPADPLANTKNTASFTTVNTDKIRIYFTNAGQEKYTALVEAEIYFIP